MRSNLVEIMVDKLHETASAVLVTETIAEEAKWLPKSQIEIEPASVPGLYVVTLPEWLATEKGFL